MGKQLKFLIKVDDYKNVYVEKVSKTSENVFISDVNDGECVRIPFTKIDEVIAAMLKLKGESNETNYIY